MLELTKREIIIIIIWHRSFHLGGGGWELSELYVSLYSLVLGKQQPLHVKPYFGLFRTANQRT